MSNYLKDKYPEYFSQLCKKRNENIYLEKILCSSKVNIWWVCPTNPCGCHIFEDNPRNFIRRGCCVYCSKTPKVCKHTSIMSDEKMKKQYHQKLNTNINPYEISKKSSKKLWWKCMNHESCDEHIWETSPSKLGECPFCLNIKVCKCNSFMNISHYNGDFCHELNKYIDPWKISKGSTKKLWWKCQNHNSCNEHFWEAAPANKCGCPFCAGKKTCSCVGSNLLKDKYPEYFSQICKERNENINLNEITYRSKKQLWWVCPINPCGCHIFQDSVNNFIRRGGCIYCSEHPKICKHTSIMSNKKWKKEFDWELNENIDPYEISLYSNDKLWWKCTDHTSCNEHIWKVSPGSRHGCPWCSNKKVCRCNSIMNNLEIADIFCQELNPDVDPWKISHGSGQELWWKCNTHKTCDKHIWKAYVNNIVDKGSRCPYCINLKTCKCMSFMNDELLAKEFDYTLNENINPWKIALHSNKELWWKCSIHTTCEKHIWCATICNRTSEQKCGCPWCANKKTCKCNSFMNNELLAKEFDYEKNINIKPWKISTYSGIKLWWKCSICEYSWQTDPHHRSNDRNCPKCNKVAKISLNEYLELAKLNNGEYLGIIINDDEIILDIPSRNICKSWWKCEKNHIFERACSSIKYQNVWCAECKKYTIDDYILLASEKNGEYLGVIQEDNTYLLEIPKNITYKSYWKCSKNHIWEASFSNIKRHSWCTLCINKTEDKLYNWLINNYEDYNIIYQYKIDWCKNDETGRYLPFDFLISDYETNIIIELDGSQHFKYIKYFDNDIKKGIERDIYKMKKCLENNYKIIRLIQEDVWENKNNWEKELKNAINECFQQVEQNIYYLPNGNKNYQIFIDKM